MPSTPDQKAAAVVPPAVMGAPVAQPMVRPAVSSVLGAPVVAARQPSSVSPRPARYGAPPVSPLLPTSTTLGNPAAPLAAPMAPLVAAIAVVTPIAPAALATSLLVNPYNNMDGMLYKHPAFPGKLLYWNKVVGRWMFQSASSSTGWSCVPWEWNPGPGPM